MDKTFVIIDGNSLINRAYFAMQRPMITKEGIYTQGIYGFLNMMSKIVSDYEPGYMAVCFDLKAPTFRHLAYSEYKAGRKGMPPELAMEMPYLKEILHAMNIRTLELEGYEADDLIGTLSLEGEKEGLLPLIITGDKDALQLASDVTKVLITKKGITDFEIYDHEKMLERYGLTPLQFIDLKGIMGDTSDNIPGIPGIGEKGGIELLTQFGSVENMLAHTDEIKKNGLRTKVEENAQLAVISKRLATIVRNVPIDINFDEFRYGEPDYKALVALYTKLEFNSFLKKLKFDDNQFGENEDAVDKPFDESEFAEVSRTLIDTEKALQKLDKLAGKTAYLKVFGDNSHLNKPEIEGIFLLSENEAFYIDCGSVFTGLAVEKLNELNLAIAGHSVKDDIYQLMRWDYRNFNICYDTAIAQYVLDVSRAKYDINALSIEILHRSLSERADGEQVGMFTDTSTAYIDEGVELGQTVFALMKRQKRMLQDENLEKVFYEVEVPLIETLAAMECQGFAADAAFIDNFGIELKSEIAKLERQIIELAGEEFNIKSTQQLGEILFAKLKLPAGKKTKKGYSTSADILEKIKDEHPIVPLVLTYRNLTKLDSTYVEGMKPLIGPDGKIRAHFQQTVTQTGRISCTEPNLQNIPVRQELGRKLRNAFKAGEGRVLIGADYSQIELRVMAHMSQDETLIDAFNRGEDIHRMTASRVLGIPMDEVTPLDRSRAKAVNFGVIYGMSGFGLSDELNITRKEAEKYISDYFDKHVKVKEFLDAQIENTKKTGYSETILGRKRAIPEIGASSFMVRQLGERLAMNSPVQGTAADIIKIAMNKVYEDLKQNYPDAKLILQVHDELIIEAREDEAEAVKELLVKDMENAMELSVKLIAEPNTAHSWYELK